MTDKRRRFDRECVEGYLFVRRPLRFLLLRRPPSRGRVWVPVSGKVDPSDPNLTAALRRELREETGFSRIARLFPLRWVFPFRGPDGGRWRLHAFAVELRRAAEPRLSREHEAFRWLSLPDALKCLHYRDNRSALRRLARRMERERLGEEARSGAPNV